MTAGPSLSERDTETPGGRFRYPWIAMGVVILGAYPFVLNITVLGVALPQIAQDLSHESSLGVDWVITSYLIAVSTIQPGTGWMADRWGKKAVYVWALVVFAIGTVIAGLAPSMGVLVVGRLIQGFGGGALMPIGLAMIYEVFKPHQRGFALGVWGVAIMAGPALGPPFGGWVTTNWSWRWIFWVMLPFLLLAVILAQRLLRDVGFREERRIDWRGWALATGGLTAIILASRQAPDWGVTSPLTVTVFVVGALVLAYFVVRGRRSANNIIDFEMFTSPVFNISMVVVALLTVGQYARLTFLPIELQFVQGRDAAEVGLLLAPSAVGVAVTMPIGGWLADRIGARIPVVVGLSVMTGSMWFLANLRPDTPAAEIVTILVVSGLGTGLAMMPNTVAAMNSLPSRFVSQASVVRSLNRQVAAALGTALLAAFVVGQLSDVVPEVRDAATIAAAQATYNRVFLIGFVFMFVTTLAALFLPGRRLMREFQVERADEHRLLLDLQE